MANDDHTPTARLTITCACCGVTITARDAFPTGVRGRFVCGNCDGNENPRCPNCTGEPHFGGALDG